MENVDDDFEVIEHDPLTCRKTVDRGRAQAMIFLQARFDFVRDRLQLRFGARRANDEEVGEAGDAGQIENDDVFSLFVGGELGAGRG
jgi:hypothetical protein